MREQGAVSIQYNEVEFAILHFCGLARSPASRMAHLKEILKACKTALGGSSSKAGVIYDFFFMIGHEGRV